MTILREECLAAIDRTIDLRIGELPGRDSGKVLSALQLGKQLKLADQELVALRYGAVVHDIGKLAIPDSVLFKQSPLTHEDWNLLRQHPIYGQKMLVQVGFLRPALEVTANHHEKWDGSGYPRGLKEENIPITARVFAVIDVFSALTADRPYRKGWAENEALAFIHEHSGEQFDPHVVEAFFQTRACRPAMSPEVLDEVARMAPNSSQEVSGEEFIGMMTAIMDLRDLELRAHTTRVAELALKLGQALNLSGQALSQLHDAAMLHDIGRIGIPDWIQFDPGHLNQEDEKILHRHPDYSAQILACVPDLVELIPAVRAHHECWDGTGYPQGLQGEEIPYLARICAVANEFDDLVSDKVYRAGWDSRRALESIAAQAGRAFDPRVVEGLATLVGAEN